MTTAREVVRQAISDWQAANSEQDIRERTLELLNKAKMHIIAEEAGVDYSFGRWNFRHFDTQTTKIIKQQVQTAAREWAESALDDMPEPTAALKKTLTSAYKKEYLEAIKSELKEAARRRAQQDAERLLDEFLQAGDLGDLDTLLAKRRGQTQTPLWS